MHILRSIVQLGKVSTISVHPFRRSYAHKQYGQLDRWTDGQVESYIYPLCTLFVGVIKSFILTYIVVLREY